MAARKDSELGEQDRKPRVNHHQKTLETAFQKSRINTFQLESFTPASDCHYLFLMKIVKYYHLLTSTANTWSFSLPP